MTNTTISFDKHKQSYHGVNSVLHSYIHKLRPVEIDIKFFAPETGSKNLDGIKYCSITHM